MHHKSLSRLRLDRRLIARGGWIKSEELERELAALPDVSHKAAPNEEPGEAGNAPAAARKETQTRPGR
jgi:hypothetical protein